jgi:hypothetical protein
VVSKSGKAEEVKTRSRYKRLSLVEHLLVVADHALEADQETLGEALQLVAREVEAGVIVGPVIKPQVGFLVQGAHGEPRDVQEALGPPHRPREVWRYYNVTTLQWAVFPPQVQRTIAAWGWTADEYAATLTPNNLLRGDANWSALNRMIQRPVGWPRGPGAPGPRPDEQSYQREEVVAQQVTVPSSRRLDHDGTAPPEERGPITQHEALTPETLNRLRDELRNRLGRNFELSNEAMEAVIRQSAERICRAEEYRMRPLAPGVPLSQQSRDTLDAMAYTLQHTGIRIPDPGQENVRRDLDPLFGRSTMGPPTDDE